MIPLYTLRKSKIWYSKFGVGKQVSSKIYCHKSVWDKIIPADVWNKVLDVLELHRLRLDYINTVCYDLKKPNIVRLDFCPGFDTEREPMVGVMNFIDIETGTVEQKYNPQIYHHKWTFVPEDYEGFDVQASYEWSRHWLSLLPEVASGYPHKWEAQLKKYNII